MFGFDKLKRHELWKITKMFPNSKKKFQKYSNTTKIDLVYFLEDKHNALLDKRKLENKSKEFGKYIRKTMGFEQGCKNFLIKSEEFLNGLYNN